MRLRFVFEITGVDRASCELARVRRKLAQFVQRLPQRNRGWWHQVERGA